MIQPIAVATQSFTARTLGSGFRIPLVARMYGFLRHFRVLGQRQVKWLHRLFRISTQMQVLQTRLTDFHEFYCLIVHFSLLNVTHQQMHFQYNNILV